MVVLEIVLQDGENASRWASSLKPNEVSQTVEKLIQLIRDPAVEPQIRNNAAYAFRDLPPTGSNVTKKSVWSQNTVKYALDELSQVYFKSGAGPAFKEIVRQAMDAVMAQQQQTKKYS